MKKKTSLINNIAQNKKALHDYSISDRFEAGLVLTGSEIKSIRDGKVSIREAYVRILGDEIFLINAHISQYSKDSSLDYDPRRTRKLLMHRKEIEGLRGKSERRGFTLVPLKIYLKRGKAKLKIGLGKGKKLYDKRKTIKERDLKRETARMLKSTKEM